MSGRTMTAAGARCTRTAGSWSRRSSATRSRRLSREHAEGPDAERAIERLARERLRVDLHHLVRLHGPDHQGRGEISRREVRARDRLQDEARETSPPTTPASTRAATSSARSPRRNVEGRARRLHRLVPDSRSGDGHQLLHARRAVGQSRLQGEDRLGEFLVRSRQGSRRREGAVRPGRRHHRPAHRLARRRCRSPRSAGCTASARRTT